MDFGWHCSRLLVIVVVIFVCDARIARVGIATQTMNNCS
jgi:hypothetical protein